MSAARTASLHRTRVTGTDALSHDEQIMALARFPGWLDLVPAVIAALGTPQAGRGRRAHSDPGARLFVLAVARVLGSTAEALKYLRTPGVWPRVVSNWSRLAALQPLPAQPPTRDHVNYLRSRMDDEHVVAALSDAFTSAAVRQARRLGNLDPNATPDWTRVDTAHMIEGDGTIVEPFSSVVQIADPTTGELIPWGSRARNPAHARVQKQVRAYGEDGKTVSGINHISVRTPTASGSIVLGVATELGAEQWGLLAIIDRIAEYASTGVHTLAYDGAVTGWVVDYLFARHRIQALGKLKAHSKESALVQESVADRAAAGEINLQSSVTRRFLRNDVMARMFHGDEPMPAGLSIYPRPSAGATQAKYDAVHSTHIALRTTHHAGDGTSCTHELVMDDGALFTATRTPEDSRTLWKQAYLRCTATRARRVPGGGWVRELDYAVPCPQGAFTYTSTWMPDRARHMPGFGTKSPSDRLGWRLRPVPRREAELYGPVSTGRNTSESFNAWFKKTLPQQSRAAAITKTLQEVDFLMAGILWNSNTWARAQDP